MRLSHKSKIQKKRSSFSPRFSNLVSKRMRNLVRGTEQNMHDFEVMVLDLGKEVYSKH